jgi:hypothetical protein
VAETREHFSRDYGCTEAEWQRWLDEATPGCRVERQGPGRAAVHLPKGLLHLQWQLLPPRRIALITLPRLGLQFDFVDTDAAARAAFMRRFDLSTQRGGG